MSNAVAPIPWMRVLKIIASGESLRTVKVPNLFKVFRAAVSYYEVMLENGVSI
jgi:hypothetical protein